MNTTSYSNTSINSDKRKNIYRKSNHIVQMHKSPKMINSLTINNKNSLSYEKNKEIINNALIKDNISKKNNLHIKCNIFQENPLKFYKNRTNDISNNKNKNEQQKKPLFFLDLFNNNNKFNDKNSHNHKVSITDTNLNSIIKVNIRNNKDKEKKNSSVKSMIKKMKIILLK